MITNPIEISASTFFYMLSAFSVPSLYLSLTLKSHVDGFKIVSFKFDLNTRTRNEPGFVVLPEIEKKD